jgi:broad specificity phosphatase PhoE
VEVAEIFLVRHAESQANAAGLWQGRDNSGLTEAGRLQAQLLARRLGRAAFDVTVSSPLTRAFDTARALSRQVVVDEQIIEIDVGRWEGLSGEEIRRQYQGELLEAFGSSNIRFGGTGETFGELSARVWAFIEELFDRLGGDKQALVVTHGGVIDAVMHRLIGGKEGRSYVMAANTSITRIVRSYGHSRLASFNDAAHLGRVPAWAEAQRAQGRPVMALIRHGRTAANVEGRWQGHSCRGLDEVGHRQAEALAAWYGKMDLVYTSPLDRARQTARRLTGGEATTVDDLRELGFGKWEGLTVGQIREGWPRLFQQIFEERRDLARGETGETWAMMTARVKLAIERLAVPGGSMAAVVTHGGAIRGYLAGLSQEGWPKAASVMTSPNTGITHIVRTDRGPMLADYAVASHLEGMKA